MAYRKLTGQVSHRHPFHGDLERQRYFYRPRFMGYGSYYHTPDMYDFDVSAVDKLYKGVQGDEFQLTEPVSGMGEFQLTEPVSGLGEFNPKTIAATLITGGLIGLGTYGVARLLLNKSKKTSRTWGLAGGIIMTALSAWADTRRE
jgi:hypothetical protein